MIDGCLSATLLLKKLAWFVNYAVSPLVSLLVTHRRKKLMKTCYCLAVKNSHLVAQDFACKQQYNNYPPLLLRLTCPHVLPLAACGWAVNSFTIALQSTDMDRFIPSVPEDDIRRMPAMEIRNCWDNFMWTVILGCRFGQTRCVTFPQNFLTNMELRSV